MNELQPGIHLNVPPEFYFALPYQSNSGLGRVLQSPIHGKHYLEHGMDTTASMFIGTAAHTAVLEPEEWGNRYIVYPAGTDLRTKAGKELRAGFEESHPDHQLIRSKEADIAWAMSEQVHRHPMAHEALTGVGKNEATFIWDHQTSKGPERCKGRVDRLTMLEGFGAVVDYKTTTDASYDGFARSVAKFGYHRQAAMYLDAMNAIDRLHEREQMKRRYIFIAQEKEPPYAAGVYELDDAAICEGRAAYKSALETWAFCKEKNRWDGYGREVAPISLPAWAMTFTGETEHDH